MTSWLPSVPWFSKQSKPEKAQDTNTGLLSDSDPGFTHLSNAGPDKGFFALSDVRERPEKADRGGSRVIALPKGRYEAPPQLAKGLKSCDLSHLSKDRDGKLAIDLELAIATASNDVITMRPTIHARNSNEETRMIYDAEMVWMEAKQGAKDCMLLGTSFDIASGEKQKKVTFPHPMEKEVEIAHWVQDFRFNTEEGGPYECDFWASHVTAEGFTANASGSKNAERLDATWIVYKKGKHHVASGSFSTDEIEGRDENKAQNSGRVEFPKGAFTKSPTVLLALSQFDLAGGRDLRIGVRAENVSDTGFIWHLNSWGEGSEDALGNAEGTWIALGFA
ncbi:hypothetical protein LTR08_003032 [Meristemomyces frigidus]|nr:hypothetical protein LTR08_003032 [Meristemomyces frigidus]